MVKDIMKENESVAPNDREITALRENFPSCFRADGTFDMVRFEEYLKDKIDISHEGYELKFLGKNYARMLASLETETVIVPDDEHNSLPENANSENIYISGDNLDGLKHLLKSYAGQVKCIYIDPPYNTGTDGFVYNDRFNFTVSDLVKKLSINEEQAQRILDLTKRGSASHSAWLMFMYPRLQLARDLLDDDGLIFISIDDNEQANVKLICDDIFGEENHLATLPRRTKSGGGSASDAFAIEHDYICVYGRRNTGKLFMPFSKEYLRRYAEEDENGKYFWDTMERSSTKTKPYIIIAPDGTKLTGKWFRSESRFKKDLASGEIRFLQKDDGNWSVQFKQRLANGKKMRSLLCDKEFKSYSDDLDDLSMNGVFSYPKTAFLIKYLLQLIQDGAVILDFFSGSATTAHAVLLENIDRLNDGRNPLKYIMVQLPENLDTTIEISTGDNKEIALNAVRLLDSVNRPHTLDQIGIERLIRAAKKIREENPDTDADLGFKHYTLRDVSANTLDKMEKFNNSGFATDTTVYDEFGANTILTTWLVHDGYGFVNDCIAVELAGYTAYWCVNHLYLINPGFSADAVKALIEKYDFDGGFNPQNIVVFGYSFNFVEMENLKTNVKILRDSEKNLKVNLDIRY